MRTLVDIKEPELEKLTRLAAQQKRPRAALIREAIADYLARQTKADASEAFGLWGDRETDGLAYQEKIRSEW